MGLSKILFLIIICYREKYLLYDNKAITGQEASEGLKELIETLRYNGYEVVYQRGDYCKFDYKG